LTNISSLAADEVGAAKHSGSIDASTSAGAADALDRIDAALLTINTQRAELGAVSNRMDHTINNLSNVSSNLQSGLSRIQDADFAKVTGDLTKSQIMSQAATAMLAQANASKQGVLSLLQG
jgi:flagellin